MNEVVSSEAKSLNQARTPNAKNQPPKNIPRPTQGLTGRGRKFQAPFHKTPREQRTSQWTQSSEATTKWDSRSSLSGRRGRSQGNEGQRNKTHGIVPIPLTHIPLTSAPPHSKILARRKDFGLRWQSAAATPLFDCEQCFQSGVALRFPPQSKNCGCGGSRVGSFRIHPRFLIVATPQCVTAAGPAEPTGDASNTASVKSSW